MHEGSWWIVFSSLVSWFHCDAFYVYLLSHEVNERKWFFNFLKRWNKMLWVSSHSCSSASLIALNYLLFLVVQFVFSNCCTMIDIYECGKGMNLYIYGKEWILVCTCGKIRGWDDYETVQICSIPKSIHPRQRNATESLKLGECTERAFDTRFNIKRTCRGRISSIYDVFAG